MRGGLVACLFALPATHAARAADPETVAAGAGQPAASDFYETATIHAKPLRRATATVTVLDRETIEALDVASVAELMHFMPGVTLASTGPRGGFATAQIRGGDPNYTYVLIDGVPLNDITDQVGGAVNLNALSTAHVERIELVRGPLSSVLGSTGLAGAINIITRHGRSEDPQTTFDVAAGDDSVFRGSAALSQGGERSDYFAGVFWEQQEDSIDAAGAQDDFEQGGAQGNARIALRGESELRITGRYAAWQAQDYPEASGGPRLGSGELRDSDHDELSLGVELRVGEPDRQHRIRASTYRHALDRDSPLIFNPSEPAASVPASHEDTTFSTWQLGWTAPQLRLGERSRLEFGADARLEDGESDSSFPALPLDLSYRMDRASGGVFAEYVIERGRASFELAARLDIPEGHDAELNPRAGLAYRLRNERTRIRASAGRAYKLPSFFALAVPVFGNPDLDPETVLGLDAGLEHEFAAGAAEVAFTVFFNRFEDLVDFDDTLFTHVNVPEVDSRGAELALSWRVSERVSLHGNVTRQDFDDEQAGDPLTHRPEWVGAARATWRLTERASWVVDGQWVSEAFDFQVPVGTVEIPGYQLFGTVVTFDATEAWQIQARVDNLADKEYESFAGFPAPDRSFRVGLRHQSN